MHRTSAFCLALFCASIATAQEFPAAAKDRHEYDLIDVDWKLKLDVKGQAIQGVVVNTVRASKDGAELYFDAVQMKIDSALINGKVAKSEHRNGVLRVTPAGQPLKKGQVVKVEISYRSEPECGVYFIPSNRAFPASVDVVYTQGEMEDTRYWIPTYDYPNDKATSSGTVVVPKGWKVLSNGVAVDPKPTPWAKSTRRITPAEHLIAGEAGEYSIFSWKMRQPHVTYLISFVAGRYSVLPDGAFKGRPVQNWVPERLETWGDAAWSRTDRMLKLYSELTGLDYPWDKYAQSAVPEFMFGGMENVTCTTNTILALFPPTALPNTSSRGLVAHELAHQWFGDCVTTPDWSHIWVNEGWATFMPHFVVRADDGEDAYHLERLGTLNGGLDAGQSTPRPMVWKEYGEPMQMFDGITYSGGAARMFMLMNQLGEKEFWRATKRYLAEYRYKNVDTEQFFASYSKSTGVNLDQFKKQWFYTPGVPVVTVKRDPKGYVIRQSTPGFELDLPVWTIKAGLIQKQVARLLPNQDFLAIANPGELVLVDPERYLLGAIQYQTNYTLDELEVLMNAAPNAAQKSALLSLWLISAGESKIEARLEVEPVEGLRRRLVENLRSPSALLRLANGEDSKLAETALNQLGRRTNDAEVLGQLQVIFRTAKNTAVQKAAYAAWLSASASREVAELGWKTFSFDESIRIDALNWFVNNEPDTAREMCLKAIQSMDHSPVRESAIRHLGRLKDEAGRRVVFDTLVSLVAERSFGPLSAAIDALVQYGDKSAIEALRKREGHGLHFIRDQVRGAISQLEAQK